MDPGIPKGLKATFAVHILVAAVFGLGFLVVPEFLSSLYGITVGPPVSDVCRLIGAAMIGWGTSSWLCLRARRWEAVRLVVIAEIVWTFLGALVTLYALLFAGFPVLGWLNFAIFAAFATVFAAYLRNLGAVEAAD